MRSFLDERGRRPEYLFVKERLFLSNSGSIFRAFFRPLAAFKAYDLEPVSQEEYLEIEAFDGTTRLGTFGELRDLALDEGLSLQVRACYRYRLNREHPHLQALARIAKLCKDSKIELIVYSTDTDYERGNEVIGEEFYSGIRGNLGEVELVLVDHGVDLLNLTFSMKKESFAHATYPDTYIRSCAKQNVARRLAEVIPQ